MKRNRRWFLGLRVKGIFEQAETDMKSQKDIFLSKFSDSQWLESDC